MKRRLLFLKKLPAILFFPALWVFAVVTASICFAADGPDALDFERIGTLKGMDTAIEILSGQLDAGLKAPGASYPLQRRILSKTGDGIGRLAFLSGNIGAEDRKAAALAHALFARTRRMLLRIQAINKKTIADLQEHQLDRLTDPLAFFQSDAWQHPNDLVAMSEYWIGWNGYYASLLLLKQDAEKKKLLNEAVDAFSNAVINFEENRVITKCLLGRALCHKELAAYEKATRDLAAVKSKTAPDDPLRVRCLYEEAAIAYQTGDFAAALGMIDGVHAAYPDTRIPGDILSGFNRLRAKVLLAQLATDPSPGGPAAAAQESETFNRNFEQLKKMAESDPQPAAEFYHYVRTHAASLAGRPYETLGTIGTAAIADFFFEQKKYADALGYYLYLNASDRAVGEDLKGDISFRLAYIYCKAEKWAEAISFLEPFCTKYPKSPSISQAARLYYIAAAKIHSSLNTEQTYQRYIDAAKCYLNHCERCPDLSEAHFQVGRYYQKTGRADQAHAEFSKVGSDSPNYPVAISQLLQATVERLEDLDKKGAGGSTRAIETYKAGLGQLKRIDECQASKGRDESFKGLSPHLLILSARLHRFGPAEAFQRSVEKLEGFEKKYPSEKQLAMTAATLRITCYQRHGMTEAAKTEAARFIAAGPIDAGRYGFLQTVAGRFYDAAKTFWLKREAAPAGRNAGAALSVYQALLDVSLTTPDHRSDTEAIRLRMAELYRNQGEHSRARDLYLRVLNDNPHSADAVYFLGDSYEQLGDWQNALAVWRRFSDGVPAGTPHWYESRYRTAHAFVQLMDTGKACTIVKMTLVLHPDFPDEAVKERFLQLQRQTCATE